MSLSRRVSRKPNAANPLYVAAFVAACFSLSTAPSHALTPQALLAKISPSIWVLTATDAEGRSLAYGSAVVVGAGRLVTNCHVLRGAKTLSVRREQVERSARLSYADIARDLCLLDVDRLGAPSVPMAPIGSASAGQNIFAVGAPNGQTATLTAGHIQALIREVDGTVSYLQVSAELAEGSSGGGLFNEDGELVGITTAALRNATQSRYFARPAEWIDEVSRRGSAALAAHRSRAAAPPASSPEPTNSTAASRAN